MESGQTRVLESALSRCKQHAYLCLDIYVQVGVDIPCSEQVYRTGVCVYMCLVREEDEGLEEEEQGPSSRASFGGGNEMEETGVEERRSTGGGDGMYRLFQK